MFNEANTVEDYLRHLLSGTAPTGIPGRVSDVGGTYTVLGRNRAGVGWHYLPAIALPRQPNDVFIETFVRDALIRLNPDIAANPDRAEEVLYRLRAIVLAVRSDGIISANEQFTEWLRGDKTMPFGENYKHVSVRLIDFDNLDNNQYIITSQYTYRAGATEKRPDLVLLVNGFPLVIIEAKTPVRQAVSWVDGAIQIHDDYEKTVPELFACNVFSVASEGKELRYGSIRMPIELWGPWRMDDDTPTVNLAILKQAIATLLQPATILDILANYTLFATDQKKRRLKVICRYQQYDAGNKILQRVIAGHPKKGLIWHFQGSGKSLLMVFTAQKLRMAPQLRNPTVLIVVDRIALDAQISSTFHASDIPNLEKANTREELETLLRQDTRKIIITTIHKFGEADGELNDRDNIIVMVDEAHRTQEGDLGRKMRDALPNAFFFGLTGTPINKRDRNTFFAFGAEEDENGYMSRYDFQDSIRDGATLPIHFEARLVELHIDKEAIDEAYAELTGGLSDLDRDNLSKAAAHTAVLVKVSDRIQRICGDIVNHYREKVEPNGFKAMVVTFDREACLLYKTAIDQYLGVEASDIVMSVASKEEPYRPYKRTRDQEEKLLDRFRNPNDPLKVLIVTAKLLTGFDASILQAIYLDKPLRDHTLLQAICRTNRTYGDKKTHGLIIDYLGVFDDVAKALEFDEDNFGKVVSGINELAKDLPGAMQKCLAYFHGCDRSLSGYEGLIQAQDCLPNNEVRDTFAADYSYLSKLWEALSPDAVLNPYEPDYRWLSQVYISVQPTSGLGRLIWHSLGAKTIELIHKNVQVEAIRDDIEAIVLDSELVELILDSPDPKQKAKEISIKVAHRLRSHIGNPRFKALSERLEALKERHEQGQIHSVAFLKGLLDLARELLETEQATPPEEDEDRGKSALTELFQEVSNDKTPKMVERIVSDIDEIVRLIRFDGWQNTNAGKREVRSALRTTPV